ncbi:Cell cycle checkpoint protein RAD17 [Cyphellophora attinorum]|uniref:Cell cycle checkpoint protein RAD17 n=1 Tax=Cyphellophora attinorum TaxID=1664694 RepID=A0A0N0NLL6_9EURO|nr:Cell cycle checkpoint protein RAD17 [Phialophora attinorum]KPI39451.1 Cell cycle checkpoint protein RAD17 [Phialophora attinorum]
MAPRPAKRQRRSTRVISDDEEEDPVPNGSPKPTPRTQRQLSLSDNGSNSLSISPVSAKTWNAQSTAKRKPKSTPQTSPEKPRKSSRIKSEPDKSKSIQNFFGKATDDQRWQRNKSGTPEASGLGEVEAIEDDELSDDALIALAESETVSSTLSRKIFTSTSNGKTTTNGHRFLKPAVPFKRPTLPAPPRPAKEESESQPPWSERYGPTTLDELAVHKKKVTDVQQWFEAVVSGRSRQKLLVLKGPAGSGKTVTVNLVTQAVGLNTITWQNPGIVDTTVNGSAAAQFDEFLNRGQFGSLGFDGAESKADRSAQHQALIVEEFPTSSSRSVGLDSVRGAVSRFLTSGSGSAQPFRSTNTEPACPAVMIISETLLNSSTAFSDSFTAHRLLGPEILNHPATTVIEFNAVAQTFVHKALDLAVKKEARTSLRRRIPGPAVMQRLAEMGDLRNAVNALEFLCVRNDSNSDWSGTVASKSKKSAKDQKDLTEMEKDSLKLVSQRETTLDMFHAAGKVVYNKREDARVLDSRAEPPPKPPDHLMHLYNHKESQIDIDALFNETGADIQTFISSLHENYVLSCNGDSFTDYFDDCAEMLSFSDVLNPESRRSIRSGGSAARNYASIQTASTDALRQDEISFHVASRGLIFHLPYPVNRAAPPSGRAADKFKMFYPTSLRLWKPTEEIDSLISMFMHEDPKDGTVSASRSASGVAGWKNTSFGQGQAPLEGEDKEDSPARRSYQSRVDLTLDILPYLARIKASRQRDTRLINRIVQVQNMSVPLTGDEPDDEEPADEAIVSATKVRGGGFAGTGNASSRRAAAGKVAASFTSSTIGSRGEESTSSQMENLFLEDDDIVDD